MTTDEQLEKSIREIIEATLDDLLPTQRSTGWVSRRGSRMALGRMARGVLESAPALLCDSAMLAERLGISERRVRALAESRGLGTKVGNKWIFTPSEVRDMQDRRTGRPPKP